jgi:hypothetical protein
MPSPYSGFPLYITDSIKLERMPSDVSGSESVVADLFQQVRWRDGVTCPRCRSDWTVRDGSY